MALSYEIFNELSFLTERKLREEIMKHCQLQTFRKGDIVVRAGQYVNVLPIVISGSIRVSQTRDDREILLYYVEPCQTCIMSLSACFFNNESLSQAIAIGKTLVLIIPTRFIVPWQKKYNSWNDFVIRTFKTRYDELLHALEKITFDHIDKRTIQYLQTRASVQKTNEIKISHEELARELGTTRVVISRILKKFELEGRLKLFRGLIKIS